MSARPLIIGTRGSRLALWQADHIEARLREAGQPTERRIIRTQGDRIQDLSFDKMEGKGFFTKEIEAELLAGTIDLAVHSCKDLETRDPEGLHIAAIAGRAAVEELLLIRREAVDARQPFMLRSGATVGTSSARRKAQLRMHRPDVAIADLRGNVPTRVEKLRAGNYDAILLAKAGIDRLGLDLSDLHVRALIARLKYQKISKVDHLYRRPERETDQLSSQSTRKAEHLKSHRRIFRRAFDMMNHGGWAN